MSFLLFSGFNLFSNLIFSITDSISPFLTIYPNNLALSILPPVLYVITGVLHAIASKFVVG